MAIKEKIKENYAKNPRATCLEAIACHRRCDDVAGAARNFADTLADFGQTLLPIPIHAIDSALNFTPRATFH